MQKKQSTFQILILVFFGISIMLGVLFISTFKGGGNSETDEIGNIIIWGTFDGRLVSSALTKIGLEDESLNGISYIEKSKTTFNHDVLEAIASGQVPDLILLDDTLLNKNKKRIVSIGSDFLTKETFKNTFVAGSEVFFSEDGGIYGLPMFIDLLVMYWNRDLYAAEGIVRPPKLWSEFYDIVRKLTKAGGNLNITQSGLAFGEAINVDNYKAILSTIFMQIGNPIVAREPGGQPVSTLSGTNVFPSVAPALSFFTDFSDSSRVHYSWNRSLPSSQESFLSSDLATYFGFGSEVRILQIKNPNLSFEVAEIPKADGVKKKSVYAKFYALAIPKAAPRPQDSFKAAQALTSAKYLPIFFIETRLTPARLDLISDIQDSADLSIFNKEAVYAESFLDPDPEITDEIFKKMVEYITSGRKSMKESIAVTDSDISSLFK